MSKQQKYQGMIIGGAIGDALGMPVEGLSVDEIREKFGYIQYFVKPRRDSKLKHLNPGQYTDDTQLMLATIKGIVNYHKLSIDNQVAELLKLKDSVRGAGKSTWRALNRLKEIGPKKSGIEDAVGCGAMTRTAPLTLLAFKRSDPAYEMLAEDVSKITHDSETSTQLMFLYGKILTNLVDGTKLDTSADIELFTNTYGQASSSDQKPVINVKEKIIELPRTIELSEETFVNKHDTSGVVWDVLHTALYCFLRSPNDFQQSVLRAVNLGGDTDSIGFVTGQLSGAYNGIDNIPQYLIKGLENNKEIKDLSDILCRKIYS